MGLELQKELYSKLTKDGFKSDKSLFYIIFEDNFNEYQRSRLNIIFGEENTPDKLNKCIESCTLNLKKYFNSLVDLPKGLQCIIIKSDKEKQISYIESLPVNIILDNEGLIPFYNFIIKSL